MFFELHLISFVLKVGFIIFISFLFLLDYHLRTKFCMRQSKVNADLGLPKSNPALKFSVNIFEF